MIARTEAVKVLYNDPLDGRPMEAKAIILHGDKDRVPGLFRVERLGTDEIANLIENGDPDIETAILGKKGGHGP